MHLWRGITTTRKCCFTNFRGNVARLEEVNAELSEKALSLAALKDEQEGQRAVLITRQDDRKATLKKINKTIASENQRIASLQADEKALKDAIEAARIAAERAAREAEVSMDGLAKLKGKLAAPVKGRIRNLFGSRRQGQVSWKGIVIDGAEGDPGRLVARIWSGRYCRSWRRVYECLRSQPSVTQASWR